MIRFIDGFDHYVSADILKKWTFTSSNTGMSIGAYGRFSSNGVRFTDSQAMMKVLPASSMFVAAWAFRTGTAAQRVIASFSDGSTGQLELRIDTNGTVYITRNGTELTGGRSTFSIPINAFVFLEWKVTFATSISANSNIVKVSGTTIINVPSGTNTQNSGNSTANTFQIGPNGGGSGYTFDYDDLYVLDGTGTVNNDFIGDRRIEVLRPAANGTHTDFAVTGAANAYAAVNETAEDGDTSYVASNTSGQIQTYTFGSLASTPSSVAAVQLGFVARKDDAGTRLIAGVITGGGGDQVGSSIGVADSYAFLLTAFELNPVTGVAWTASDLASLEAGFKLVQ